MSPKAANPESMRDNPSLSAFTISQLFPSNSSTKGNNAIGIHSPYGMLVALLKGQANLKPGDLTISAGQVLLIPPTYPCDLLPKNDIQLEFAAIDFCFRYHGMDISGALPATPTVIPENSAGMLTKDICIVCNSDTANPDITQTTEQLAAGYRIANSLSNLLEWNKNPIFTLSEDKELQALTAYLNANCYLPLTIEDIAADCNLSRRQAFVVASRHACRTPMRILKQIRLERSLDYLRRDEISISQAAAKVGFNDAKNFSREFKKSYGMTPVQYRQQSQLNLQTEQLVNKADAKMQANLCKRAAELYLQAIDNAPPNTDLSALHYKAGRALKQAGDNGKAKATWNKVSSLYYRLLVKLDNCEYLNKSSDSETIIEELREVYDYGDSKLKQRAVARLGKWMLECATSQKQRAAVQYSQLAKDLVRECPGLRPNLARTLFATGQFKDIEPYCPDQPFFIAGALRAMGLYQDHLDRFPELRHQNAMLLLRMEKTDELLSSYQDQPVTCVKALIDIGRSEDACRRFPEHCAQALMVLGRFDEILMRHRDDFEMCAFALANMGRESEALALAASSNDLSARLLFSLERSHDLTSSPSREFTVHIVRAASVLQGIHALEKGDLRYGLEILDSVLSITEPEYRIGHEFYEVDLIVLLIRHILTDVLKELPPSKWPPLRDHLREVVKHWRYCYDQRLWYDARFILGDINEAEYRSQPHRRESHLRLAFAKAVKHELNGEEECAIDNYRAYIDALPPNKHCYGGGPITAIKAFIRWRLQSTGR